MYLKLFTALLKMHFNVYSDIHDGLWVKDALETNSNIPLSELGSPWSKYKSTLK